MNLKPLLTDYDKDPCPNLNPSLYHGVWTEWPELHNQKSLSNKFNYLLRLKGPIPEGGKPFFVEKTHPLDGGNVTMTLDQSAARKFRGTYLMRTMWNWELQYEAVPA